MLNMSAIDEICHDYIIESGKKTLSMREIGTKYGISYNAVRQILINKGVSVRKKGSRLHLNKDEIKHICDLYERGQSSTEIADLLIISTSTVLRTLKEKNVRIKLNNEHCKYDLNENAFDTITETSAYWIGFLMADGYIRDQFNNLVLELALQIRDRQHIKKFIKFLEYNNEESIKNIRSSNGKFHKAVKICVCSHWICVKLSEYGVTPRKSLTAKVTGLENDPNFWRGMIDGDGWICKNGVIGLCGSDQIINQFYQFCVNHCKIPIKANRRKQKNLYILKIGSRPQALSLMNILYQDSTIYLDRKYELYQNLKSEFNQRWGC